MISWDTVLKQAADVKYGDAYILTIHTKDPKILGTIQKALTKKEYSFNQTK